MLIGRRLSQVVDEREPWAAALMHVETLAHYLPNRCFPTI